jgi:glucose-6-phosphate 1-epimerase
MSADLAEAATELNRKFGIPGVAEIVPGQGGLPKVRVVTAEASGEIYLHGAQVTSWKPAGRQDVLWLSQKSMWQDGQPIRGGVPICFPWFGPNRNDALAPSHGLARLNNWSLDSIEQCDGAVNVTCSSTSDDRSRQWVPGDCELRFRASFGSKLVMGLELLNTGTTPLQVEEALHTYYSVGDVRQVRVQGLDGSRYLDRLKGQVNVQRGTGAITAETEWLFSGAQAVEIDDPVLRRRIRISSQNSAQALIWNPWIDKARRMPDFGDDEWPRMLCVETCNVLSDAITVAPGQRHAMTAIVEVFDKK